MLLKYCLFIKILTDEMKWVNSAVVTFYFNYQRKTLVTKVGLRVLQFYLCYHVVKLNSLTTAQSPA